MPITAGAAKVNITPPIGFPLAGYGNRDRGCEHIEHQLFAKALVIEDSANRIAIVTSDLISLPSGLVARVRKLVHERTGIPGTHLMACASHTHFGPALKRLSYLPAEAVKGFYEAYVENLVHLLASAVEQADKRRCNATIGFGLGAAGDLVFNRRPKDSDGKLFMAFRPPSGQEDTGIRYGPTDPDVGVLRIDAASGDPLAVLLTFACHPVCGVDKLYAVSPDYPHYAMKLIEDTYDCTCMFGLGCAGNIVPVEREGTARERIGTALGAEALRVMQKIETRGEVSIATKRTALELPLRQLPSLEQAKAALVNAERKLADWECSVKRAEDLSTPRGELVHARHILGLVEELGNRTTIETEIQVLHIGELTIVGLPGEVFVEIGLAIKDVVRNCVVLELCNDSLDYVPIAEAYEEGGYEPEWTKLAPRAGEMLCDGAIALANAMRISP